MNRITEAWEINNRVNLYLLDAIPEEALGDQAPTKGRTVGETWAHIHNVRLMWLKVSGPEIPVAGKIEKEHISHGVLRHSLTDSGKAIALLLESAMAQGKIKGFKPTVEAFFAYMTAHEAYHRGQLILALKANKHMPDKKILYGMWEWGVR